MEIVLELKYEYRIGWIKKYLGLQDFGSLEYGMKRKLNKLLIPIFWIYLNKKEFISEKKS